MLVARRVHTVRTNRLHERPKMTKKLLEQSGSGPSRKPVNLTHAIIRPKIRVRFTRFELCTYMVV